MSASLSATISPGPQSARQRRAKLGLRSQARHLVSIRQLFRFLVKEKVLKADPAADIEMPRPLAPNAFADAASEPGSVVVASVKATHVTIGAPS